MNLNEIWQELNTQPPNNDWANKDIVYQNLKSNDPVGKIIKNVKINTIYAVVISLLYVVVIFKFNLWQVRACLVVVLCYSAAAIVANNKLLKYLTTKNPFESDVLSNLQFHHSAVKKWIRFQERAGFLIYPIAAFGGYMLGGHIGSGKSIESFMAKPFVIGALVVVLAIVLPLTFYMARWMLNYSFGKYLKQIEGYINQLNS